MSADQTDRGAADVTRVLLGLVEELLCELHPGRAPARTLALDSSLDRDVGLDSLARVELLARVERRFGIALPERAFSETETLRDVLHAVLAAGESARGVQYGVADLPELADAEASPASAETLVEVLNWHAAAHPERPHVRLYRDDSDGDVITYGELLSGAQRIAGGLQANGLLPGQTVALMLPTSREYFLVFFGVLLAGGVPVPMYPPASRRRLEDHLRRHQAILSNCAAQMLVTYAEATRVAQLLRAQVKTLHSVTTVEELRGTPSSFLPTPVQGRDLAFLQYTSGSTGNPKGVMLTHRNLLANVRAMGTAVAVSSRDVFVSWLPLYHDMGLIGAWFGSLYHAMQLVVMSPLSFIARPERWLRALHRYRGTMSAAPNFAYELCLRRLGDAELSELDLSSWRVAFNGAEPVSAVTLERFCERFGQCGFQRTSMMPVFGLAECSVGLAFPPTDRGPVLDVIRRSTLMNVGKAVPVDSDEADSMRVVACGRPLPGHEIRIADARGRELPEREEGRLQFRGPSACQGYFHDPEHTRALFAGDWLDSGDLAYMNAGDVYVTGRRKDLIIRSGRNIHPQDLEEAVGELDGVRQGGVAVFGIHDAASGTERLVVLAESRARGEEALRDVRARVVATVTDLVDVPPDEVVLAPPGTVPRTSSGKVRRAASRELVERGGIGRQARFGRWQLLRYAAIGVLTDLARVGRRLLRIAYGAYAWILFALFAPVVWPVTVLLPRYRWRWWLLHQTGRLLARLLRIPLAVHGLENLSRDGPFIVVGNHASYLDVYVLVATLPVPVRFVGKAELRRSFFLRLFLERLRTEFVERFDKEKGLEDARRLARDIDNDAPLFFFAEGTFTRAPGLFPFHLGAFMAAAQAGVPVVPVALRGTRSSLRAETWLLRRTAVTVTVGEGIEPGPPAERDDTWAEALQLRAAARAYILRFCGEPDSSHERAPI